MKNSTQQIFNLIESDDFQNVSELREKVNSYGWWNPEHQEMTFEEACRKFSEIVDLLSWTLSNSGDSFESVLSFGERSQILSFLQNIGANIRNTKDGSNQIVSFIQQVQGLWQLIKSTGLDSSVNWYPKYQDKLKQVGYLKQKYEDLILKLNRADELFEKAKLLLEDAEKAKNGTQAILDTAKTIEQGAISTKTSIDQLHSDITQANKSVISYEAEVKQMTESIKVFFGQIEGNDAKMKKGFSDLNKFIETTTASMNAKIMENDAETERILNENDTLQKTIKQILGASIGTNLYKSFEKKSRFMFWQSIFWLVLLVLSIWFLTNSGQHILEELKPLLENGKLKDLSLTFYLRLTLIFPAIYAVYFSTSEFRNTNKLKEEYDFKSSVAVALNHFTELVNGSKEDKEGTQRFLIDSIAEIFKSPTDRAFGKTANENDITKKAKDMVSDLASITSDIANKILPTK